MGPQFFQTIMGRTFYEGTVPALVRQLEKLNANLEKSGIGDTMTADQLANSDTREDALSSALRLVLKDVFESEVADHVKFEHLNVAMELSNFKDEYPNVQVRGCIDNIDEMLIAMNEPIAEYCTGGKLGPEEIVWVLRAVKDWCDKQIVLNQEES